MSANLHFYGLGYQAGANDSDPASVVGEGGMMTDDDRMTYLNGWMLGWIWARRVKEKGWVLGAFRRCPDQG